MMNLKNLLTARKAAKAAHEQGVCPLCESQVRPESAFCGQCGCNLKTGVKLASADSIRRLA